MPFLIYFITELIGYSPTYKKNPEYISKIITIAKSQLE
tara:strand:+ start:9862 stop:9975 length:114 start_codon:yes stop_codon:yes gene_type:complete